MPNEMDTGSLLNVGPEELASSLLKRRLMLKESLPGVIRNLEAEQDSLAPKVKRHFEAFQAANKKVSNLKNTFFFLLFSKNLKFFKKNPPLPQKNKN